MFHKVNYVYPLKQSKLLVQFAQGATKIYDVEPLINKNRMFFSLKDESLFYEVKVDVGGYGIVWNDDIDISCDELWANGKTIRTDFDGLIAISDATKLWGLNESTLRKAISYGKLKPGTDVCKFGNQWVVTLKAMNREYENINYDTPLQPCDNGY